MITEHGINSPRHKSKRPKIVFVDDIDTERHESIKRVARVLSLLFDSVFQIFFILYLMGITGIIRTLKNGKDKYLNFYTGMMIFNLIMITLTLYLFV